MAADTNKPSVTLKWDPPANAEDVTMYDICYRQSNNWQLTNVKAPASSVLLTSKDGLIPRVTYDFEVRARNAECVGEWSGVSKHTGTFLSLIFTVTNQKCHKGAPVILLAFLSQKRKILSRFGIIVESN